ncbi:reverse transcriptase domain-containing protein [Serratia ureilytica]|uniref:reverse transcriptase domain-containing protein n=1 Tax=Serratia ureilytica TaxID=300181 RepID=UPI0021C359B1|nr:reverse transcriptase domain-containing protein [Serratia ureilytica]
MTRNLNNDRHGDSRLLRASEYLDNAWLWLCEHRQHAPADADVWHLRYHWEQQRASLLATLLAGEYRLSPMLIVGRRGEEKAMWGAQDALVLKWVALHIADDLPLHARCEHVKGHGGGAASVRKMAEALRTQGYRWVLRTDVKGYYANIDKATLLSQVNQWVHYSVMRDLMAQYVHYTVEDGGTFHTPKKGIGRSCPLSPLMGALYLHEMDEHFGAAADEGRLYYARYMDDIVVLTHSRWHLRRHVRKLNQFLAEKALCQHPDKTFIGRTSKGFDWMGAWLEPQGVTDIAPRAKANHREKVRRLYERARRMREPKGITQRRVSTYRWRWTIWAGALLVVSGTARGERIVIPAGAGGVVAYTAQKTASFSRLMPAGNSRLGSPFAGVCVSSHTDSCPWGSTDGVDGPTTGARGWAVTGGPTQGGAVIPVGTVTASRALDPTQRQCFPSGNAEVRAIMVLPRNASGYGGVDIEHTGTWTGTGGEPLRSGYDLVRGQVPSTWATPWYNAIQFVNNITVGVPLYGYAGQQANGCTSTGVLSSHFSVALALDAPPGGMLPGKYTTVPIYALDNILPDDPTNRYQLLLDSLDLVVAATSCSLSADNAVVALSTPNPTATTNLQTSCSYSTSDPAGSPSVDVRLAAAPAGTSTTSSDSEALIPDGAPDLRISGAWSSTPPACGHGTVKFDGSDGPSLGTLKPGDLNFQRSQPVSFRLCGSAPPGTYTAQAVFQVVGR